MDRAAVGDGIGEVVDCPHAIAACRIATVEASAVRIMKIAGPRIVASGNRVGKALFLLRLVHSSNKRGRSSRLYAKYSKAF